ncbi:hypothetical protein [Maribacter flavus]|uniref:Uncharacterized protein n=1 Tax=Maribacter flavus TaxID=1658664 RepID=A0A5B2TSB9_9FLAO|nr:hypothetical protein [Maribacter flavus]KAA2217214.1 hypothetical protein F0361_14750 [Maribacter flavus]
MNRTELFDKILKHLIENQDDYRQLIPTCEKYFGVTDRRLIESVCDELIERGWVTTKNNDKYSLNIHYNGIQMIEEYGSYSSFLHDLKKSNNKKQVQKSTDRKLNNISKISAIVFGLSAFILSYYKIIDDKKIEFQKAEIENLNGTIDSLKTELKNQLESESRNYKNEVSEFALNFSPKGASTLDSIPEYIVEGFRKLRTIDKNAHEKYVTLIFTKLYAEHLQCCHQGYIIASRLKNDFDKDKVSMVNEFAFMSNYVDYEKLPEAWSSGIIEKWLAENPKLLEFEPIGKYKQRIDSISNKIANGDYWNN